MSNGRLAANSRTRPGRVRSERLGWLVMSLVLALPLLADPIAEALGFEVFYLADSKLQAVWGTLAQAVGGWPLYAEAVRQLRRGGAHRAVGFALVSTLVYAAGLYLALGRSSEGGILFLGSALLISAAHLIDYLEARHNR